MSYNDGFSQPKPPKFSLILPLTPDRTARFDADPETFNTLLDTKLNKTPEQSNQASSAKASQHALPKAILDATRFQQGSDFRSQATTMQSEFIKSKQNHEYPNQVDYVNYSAAFASSGFNQNTIDDIKKRKKIIEQDGLEEDEASKNAITYSHNLNQFGSIISHNPFKKQDDKHFQSFEGSPLDKLLNKSFLSTQRELGEDTFNKTQSIMKKIISPSLKMLDAPDNYSDNNIDSFEIHSNYHTIEKEAQNNEFLWEKWTQEESYYYLLHRDQSRKSYEKTIRQFSGPVKTHHKHIARINSLEQKIHDQNEALDSLYDDLLTPVTKLWNDIHQNPAIMFEDSFYEKFQNILLSIEESESLIETHKDNIDPANLDTFYTLRDQIYDAIDANTTTEVERDSYLKKQSLKHSTQWWNTTGQYLSTGWLLPYAQMGDMAKAAIEEAELGLSFHPEDPNNLQEKLLLDTTTQLYEKELSHFTPTKKLQMSDLESITEFPFKLYDQLITAKVIDDSGNIITKNSSHLDLDLNLDSSSLDSLHKILTKKNVGAYSLSSIDRSVINDKSRKNILLTDPYGNTHDIPSIIDSINPKYATDSIESYKHSRDAYNILFDILETMSGDALAKNGKLVPDYKTDYIHKEPIYILPVYPNATWEQYNNAIPINSSSTDGDTPSEPTFISGWETQSKQPLSLTFESLDELHSFYSTIKETILKLEPLVSTFEPRHQDIKKLKHFHDDPEVLVKPTDITQYGKSYQADGTIIDTPIRRLVDNFGTVSSTNTLIKPNDSEFKYFVDHTTTSTLFETKHMKQNMDYIQEKIVYKIGKDIFTMTLVNRFNKNTHKRKVEKYKEEKDKWKKEQYELKKSNAKLHAKKRARRKRILREYYNAIKKRQIELKKSMQRADAIRRAKNRSKKAASKKRS